MSEYFDVASVDDVPKGTVKYIQLDEYEILLINLEGQFYAISNRCGHMSASLADGTLEGNVVTCPFHAAQFNVTTGEKVADAVVVPPPAIEKAPSQMLAYLQKAGRLSAPIKTYGCRCYDVRVIGGKVQIKIE